MLAFCGIFQVVARIAEELLFQLDGLAAHHQEADDVWNHRYPEDEIEELEDEFQTANGAEEDGGDVAKLDQLGEEGAEEVFRLFFTIVDDDDDRGEDEEQHADGDDPAAEPLAKHALEGDGGHRRGVCRADLCPDSRGEYDEGRHRADNDRRDRDLEDAPESLTHGVVRSRRRVGDRC